MGGSAFRIQSSTTPWNSDSLKPCWRAPRNALSRLGTGTLLPFASPLVTVIGVRPFVPAAWSWWQRRQVTVNFCFPLPGSPPTPPLPLPPQAARVSTPVASAAAPRTRQWTSRRRTSDEVDDGEQEHPDDVDEVPVDRRRHERPGMARAELAHPGPVERVEKRVQADEHVRAVEAGQAVEDRPEDPVLRREPDVGVLVDLDDQERRPEHHGH